MGSPSKVPWMVVRQWMQLVAKELAHPSRHQARLNTYACTNEHEFFAMLATYFFTLPVSLEQRDTAIYALMRDLFHQDPRVLFSLAPCPSDGLGRNAACPCRSEHQIQTQLSRQSRLVMRECPQDVQKSGSAGPQQAKRHGIL